MAAQCGDEVTPLVPTRRTFIKVGIGGAALFATARFAGGARAAAPAYRLLDEKAAGIVRALAPVVLAGSLPDDDDARERAVAAIVASFDRTAAGLAPAVQKEITDLFAFLDFAPTRVTFAGLWSPIGESTAEELAGFLTRWRNSRFELHGLDPDSEVPVYFLEPKRKLGATVYLPGKSVAARQITVRLQPCGMAQAEYDAWLAMPDRGVTFIEDACTALRDAFPRGRIEFLFLPPNAPLGHETVKTAA